MLATVTVSNSAQSVMIIFLLLTATVADTVSCHCC